MSITKSCSQRHARFPTVVNWAGLQAEEEEEEKGGGRKYVACSWCHRRHDASEETHW